MLNPARALASQFLRANPLTLLLLGTGLALLDFVGLYVAAERNGVLWIPGGIGLLQDYGLLSSIAGNTILVYIARRYYQAVCSVQTSVAVTTAYIKEPIETLTSMIRMERHYQFVLYGFVIIGAIYWAANAGVHLFGSAEARWGHKVFDSTNHWHSFLMSRVHNAFTWMFVLPLVGHVVVLSSVQLRSIINVAAQKGGLRYDLLNPDHRGGFSFIEQSRVFFNLLIAIVYVQITMHIGTFDRMNIEHLIAYVVATLLLLAGNNIIFGTSYRLIDEARIKALNTTKDNVYKNDALSFEILRYCYERRLNRFSVANIITKTAAIALSAAVKLLPLLAKGIHLRLQ